MHKLLLKNVGPIKDCEIELSDFNIFMGAQASGKSTVAKAIFFFRTVKDDILECIIKRNTLISTTTLYKTVLKQLRNKFLQIFGTSRAMSNDLFICYYYSEETYIKINLKLQEGVDFISPNYIFFEFSKSINDFLSQYSNIVSNNITDMKSSVVSKLQGLFCDEYETIFIPAGRSLITLLTNQLNYIYTSMDDEQKRLLDFCTQKYVERILKIRSSFNNGVDGFLATKDRDCSQNIVLSQKAIKLSRRILKGKYVFSNGEEKLFINDNKYIKINYTSSGQQETVWIFNILLYQLINNTKTFVILEEPEAHLYPSAQKTITELLGVFLNNGNSALITTHSPYILGTVNNLLFAHKLSSEIENKKIDSIIEKSKQVNACNAYVVFDGKVTTCIDDFDGLIKNEVIDEASQDINKQYDCLVELLEEE